MEMSTIEIIGRYNRADNKGEIIKILAELNGCSKEYIKTILETEAGIKFPKKAAAKVDKTQEKKPLEEKQQETKPQQAAVEKIPDIVLQAIGREKVLIQEQIDRAMELKKGLQAQIDSAEEIIKEKEKELIELMKFVESRKVS